MKRTLRSFINVCAVQMLTILLVSNQLIAQNNKKVYLADVATTWADMTLYIIKNTKSSTPTYNSRTLGYMGLTMYESIVAANPEKKSIAEKINLPKLIIALPKKFSQAASINASQATMLRLLYPHIKPENAKKIDSLENYFIERESIKKLEVVASSQYGKSIAENIFRWSKEDGGHEGFKRNFDTTYIVPQGKGFWEAPPKGQIASDLPLHPHWGKNRTFAPHNFTLPIPEMLPFGYQDTSLYFQEMKAVFEKGKALTQAEKEAANWWGDDPGHSYSPPGHSYNLATIAIKTRNANLFAATEAYAKVGMGVSDAFINCWKCKYHYHIERPAHFIFFNISTLWELYWPEPPFPAFYSGHATQAAATAVALTSVFGENFAFTDDTNTFIPKDELHNVEYKARQYQSFWEAAEETAMSRFYGGIHTKYDNEIGKQEGTKIGQNIINLFNSK
jgi:PAP2 superfamily